MSSNEPDKTNLKHPYYRTFKKYALSATIHGIDYVFEKQRKTFERVLWVIVVLGAILISSSLSFSAYKYWKEDPILTSVGTTGFPIEKIEFPAITICGQGLVNEVVDAALFHQFNEYLVVKGKQFSELDPDEVIEEGQSFLIDMYPGAKMVPNQLVRILASPDEDVDKIIKTEAFFFPQTLTNNCSTANVTHQQENKSIGRKKRYTANKSASECPGEAWWYNGHGSCLHYNPNGRQTWDDATAYCALLGDGIGILEMEDEGSGYSTLWDALNTEGKFLSNIISCTKMQ